MRARDREREKERDKFLSVKWCIELWVRTEIVEGDENPEAGLTPFYLSQNRNRVACVNVRFLCISLCL